MVSEKMFENLMSHWIYAKICKSCNESKLQALARVAKLRNGANQAVYPLKESQKDYRFALTRSYLTEYELTHSHN